MDNKIATSVNVVVNKYFSGECTPVSDKGGKNDTCFKNTDNITHVIKEKNAIGVRIKGRK